MKCRNWKTYKGIKPPKCLRSGCDVCWRIWGNRIQDLVDPDVLIRYSRRAVSRFDTALKQVYAPMIRAELDKSTSLLNLFS